MNPMNPDVRRRRLDEVAKAGAGFPMMSERVARLFVEALEGKDLPGWTSLKLEAVNADPEVVAWEGENRRYLYEAFLHPHLEARRVEMLRAHREDMEERAEIEVMEERLSVMSQGQGPQVG